jgi:undecaprenyl diphosphate synthase
LAATASVAAPMNRAPRSIPRHIAIILDGNGRWAKQRGLARIFGHEEGAQSVRQSVEGCGELGVEFLTLYAFSQENWSRPAMEVNALMNLLQKFLSETTPELVEKNVRLRAIGRLSQLPEACQEQLRASIETTAGCTGLTLILALSYSGRAEVIDAVKSLVADVLAGRLREAEIDAEVFSQHLYTRDLPDPDLLIRTSGEMRLSNFLLWQLSYTEIHFTKTLWPDFRKEDLLEAVRDYSNRQRRYGSV